MRQDKVTLHVRGAKSPRTTIAAFFQNPEVRRRTGTKEQIDVHEGVVHQSRPVSGLSVHTVFIECTLIRCSG